MQQCRNAEYYVLADICHGSFHNTPAVFQTPVSLESFPSTVRDHVFTRASHCEYVQRFAVWHENKLQNNFTMTECHYL